MMIQVEFDKALTEKAVAAIAKGKPIEFGEAADAWTQSRAIQAAAVFMDVAFHFGPSHLRKEQLDLLPDDERAKVLNQFHGDVIAAVVHCLGLTQVIRGRDYDRRFEPKLTLEIESKGPMPISVTTHGMK